MQQQNEHNSLTDTRLAKLEAMEAEGIKPFEITSAEQSVHSADVKNNFESFEGSQVTVAGRIVAKRGMGKASFADLSDLEGRIQIFTKVDVLGEEAYKRWLSLDLGDLVSVKGEVFQTKKGEISIKNMDYTLLAKALRPLPEKFHGLKDTDTRYRKRYLDLIVNPDVRDSFIKRGKIIRAIRETLLKREFIEVETPLLNLIPGGAEARPFITHHNTLDLDLYLRISPELYLKRLIVGGFERVFEIGRNFRNEGMSVKHNPEFTMVEMYQAFTDYKGMMELCEIIIKSACDAVCDSRTPIFDGKEINLDGSWERLSMTDAVKKYADVDFSKIQSDEEAIEAAMKAGLAEHEPQKLRKGEILNLFFEEFCEKRLIQPTFIYDYPVEISPLTKRCPENPELTERFELFINGTEYGNAYSELNDPRDQRRRFQDQLAKRMGGDEEANIPDEDFVEALEYGMPPCGGLGIGIDRLVMLLTDNSSIRDVLLFPTMKPLNKGAQSTAEEPQNSSAPSLMDASLPNSTPSEPEAGEAKTQVIDFTNVRVEPLFEEYVDFETFSKSDFRAVKVLACEEIPKSKKLLKFTLDDGSGENRIILSGIKEYYKAEDLQGKTCVAITNLPPRAMMGIDSCGMLISAIHKDGEEERLNLLMLDPAIPAGAKLY